MTAAAFSYILYDSRWIFLFLGGCVWYMCVTLAYHPHEEKRQLFWTLPFNSSPLLHSMVSPRAYPTFKRTWWLHAANFHTAAGTSHLVPYQFPSLCRWSLFPQKAGDQAVYSYFFVHSVQMLCLTFINLSMITNMFLLAELEHILKIFSSSWQHSWSSSVSRASRFEQLEQYFAICVDKYWVINKCGLVAACVWFIHVWVMVKPASGFTVDTDFSAFKALEFTLPVKIQSCL